MSDLFISEILILLFLLPVLLRPFSETLKNVPAVLMFPLFSIVLCVLTIAGQGIYFSNFIILFFSIVIFIFTLSKLFAFFGELSTNIYSITEKIFSALFLLCTFGLFFLTWKSAPYSELNISGKIITQDIDDIGKIYKLEQPDNKENQDTLIIFLPNRKKSFYETNTIVRSLLQNGNTVLCIENFEELLPIIPKNFYNFIESTKLLFNKIFDLKEETSFSHAQEQNFIHILKQLISRYEKQKNIYIFSDGIYNDLLVKNIKTIFEKNVRGVFVICSEQNTRLKNVNLSDIKTYYAKKDGELNFTGEIKNANILFYEVPSSTLPEFSEMPAEDVLATILLGSKPDIGRNTRKEIASTFEKWLFVKEN